MDAKRLARVGDGRSDGGCLRLAVNSASVGCPSRELRALSTAAPTTAGVDWSAGRFTDACSTNCRAFQPSHTRGRHCVTFLWHHPPTSSIATWMASPTCASRTPPSPPVPARSAMSTNAPAAQRTVHAAPTGHGTRARVKDATRSVHREASAGVVRRARTAAARRLPLAALDMVLLPDEDRRAVLAAASKMRTQR